MTRINLYIDGSEDYIEEVILQAKDLSWTSAELARKASGWAQNYHLSPARAGLLMPLMIGRQHSVLDIGSGCGALTRYLGETAGSVLGIESTAQRARITQLRCRDLSNVNVLTGNLHELQTSESFDIATMVGVLEYSANFLPGEDDPFQSMLEAVRHHLSKQGVLILAIENKFGLKYFAGYREDHTSKCFEGIEGYPSGSRIRTFGRRELLSLLQRAGFASVRLLGAYPDYKFPKVIIALDKNTPVDTQPFLYQLLDYTNAHDGSGNEPYELFREHLVYKQLETNGMFADMANSYLVLAADSEDSLNKLLDPQLLICKMNLYRNRHFMTKVALTHQAQNTQVLKQAIFPEEVVASGPLKLHIQHEAQPYHKGHTLMEKLYQSLAITDADPDKAVKAVLKCWHEFLKNEAAALGSSALPGEYWDCTPWNILVTENNKLIYYDRELVHSEKLSVKYILFRGLLYVYHLSRFNLEPVYFKHKLPNRSFKTFLSYMLNLIGENVDSAELENYFHMEWLCISQCVTCTAPSWEKYLEYGLSESDSTTASKTLQSLENRISEMSERLQAL